MPTTNSRGFPLYSSTEAMPGWAAAYNAHSNLLSTALDVSEQASKDDDAVESIADLPETGNWAGRIIFVEENDMLYVWDGTGWWAFSGKLPYYFGSRSDSAVDSGITSQTYITTTTSSRGITMSSGVLTFQTPGIYKVDQSIVWSANSIGQRNLGIDSPGGVTVLGPSQSYEAADPSFEVSESQSTYILVEEPGATARPFLVHNSGSALNVYGTICVMWVSA